MRSAQVALLTLGHLLYPPLAPILEGLPFQPGEVLQMNIAANTSTRMLGNPMTLIEESRMIHHSLPIIFCVREMLSCVRLIACWHRTLYCRGQIIGRYSTRFGANHAPPLLKRRYATSSFSGSPRTTRPREGASIIISFVA